MIVYVKVNYAKVNERFYEILWNFMLKFTSNFMRFYVKVNKKFYEVLSYS